LKKNLETWDKVYSRIFSGLFFVILLLQLVGPNLHINAISEHFLWRMDLIENFNNFRYSFGDHVFNAGLVGKDGWLFYSGDFSINDYQKTSPVGRNRLKEFGKILGSLNERVAKYGGILLVVIPPDKNTIYPQYMPDQIPVIGQTSRLDQLVDYFQKNTQVNVIDLRPVFTDVSKSSQIYYKKDAHWNCLGAYYASNEILSQISPLHAAVELHPLSDFQLGSTLDSSLDISTAMGLGFHEDSITLTPKFPTGDISHESYDQNPLINVSVNSQTELPRAVILHDSFYPECLNQFLEPQFSQVISTHYETALLPDYIKLIDVEKPDVVIVEFAERHIEYFFKLLTRETK
jgi:hypothetical protein